MDSLSRSRSRSSSGTVRHASGRPAWSDDDDDDSAASSSTRQPPALASTATYTDRLSHFLGRQSSSSSPTTATGASAARDDEPTDQDDEEEFVYRGQDGLDEELARRRLEDWSRPEAGEEEAKAYEDRLDDILRAHVDDEEDAYSSEKHGRELEIEDLRDLRRAVRLALRVCSEMDQC